MNAEDTVFLSVFLFIHSTHLLSISRVPGPETVDMNKTETFFWSIYLTEEVDN